MARPREQTAARERFLQIYSTIRERICVLDYPPDSRISEEELAAEFNVSRTPVRRVMNRLESEGLVESRVGFGTLVTSLDYEGLGAVYKLRVELADLLARLDPMAPGESEIARSREILATCDALLANPSRRALARLNMAFFEVMSACTGNAPLREISERLYFLSTRVWFASLPDDRLTQEIEAFKREVGDIVDALELGDMPAVAHIRCSHISTSYRRIRLYAERAKALPSGSAGTPITHAPSPGPATGAAAVTC